MATDERNKLCREIAERHDLGEMRQVKYSHGESCFAPDDNALAALREAYDKGHDAGAREQREKDGDLVANTILPLDQELGSLKYRVYQCLKELATAIRAGRE